MIVTRLWTVCLFCCLIIPVMVLPVFAASPMENMGVVALRTIDKLSARTLTFDIPVGKTVKFGESLFIRVQACRKSAPIDQPESAAFLQIWERKSYEDESRWVFSGWMFASSPSLSALQHPVYDVWVIDCKKSATTAKSEDFTSESAPAAAPADTSAEEPAAE